MKNNNIIQLSFQDSQKIRGIAILMMIFLHCFNSHPQNDYVDFIIAEQTLSYWLTDIAGLCVPLYCFLSGYGLYKKFPYDFSYCKVKSILLIRRYWTILLFFFVLGVTVFDAYTIEWEEIFSNFLGYNTTYNPTLWFLLPYLLVMLASPLLLKWFNNFRLSRTIGVTGVVYCIVFYCLKMHALGEWNIPDEVRVVLESFKLLLSFLCGAVMAKYGILRLTITQSHVKNNLILIFFILCLAVARSIIPNNSAGPFFGIFLIILLANVYFSSSVSKVFECLGKHSLNMWFIHAYFIYEYLDFTVYWLKFPILIFCMVILYSYILSFIANKVFERLNI